MNVENMTNADLLTFLVGRDVADAIAKKPLAEAMGFTQPRQRVLSEAIPNYAVHPALAAAKEIFFRCIREQLQTEPICLSAPGTVKAFLCSKIGHLEHEAFWCLWLDTQHRLINAGELFRGTLSQTAVYPREVVKQGLACNAGAVVFAHNHPSGTLEPSPPDERLTASLKAALALVDIRVLDHFIISGNQAASFAERGLL